MTQAKAKIFVDHKGNRFLFPAYVYPEGSDDLIPLATTFWSIGLEMKVAVGIDMEEGWFEFDDEKFPHVVTTLIHPGFAHGGATTWVFEGPTFDEVANAA